jgi:hypothetical protein
MNTTSKRYLRLLPILGLLLVFAGYLFFSMRMIDMNTTLSNKLDTIHSLDSLKKAIVKSIDSCKASLDTMNKYYYMLFDSVNHNGNFQSADLKKEADKINNSLQIAKNEVIKKYNPVVQQKTVGNIKGTIYIQVNSKEAVQNLKKSKFIESLNKYGYKAYGYEVVGSRANNQLKYFHDEDNVLANQLISDLKIIGLDLKLNVDMVPGFDKKVPFHQMELWIKM